MKKFLILLLLFTVAQNFGQSLVGYYVTNANDTIKCKFWVETNMFDRTMLYAASATKKVKIVNEKDKIVKFRPMEIKSFEIQGTKYGNYKFVSLAEDPSKFYHEIVAGKLSYYLTYTENLSGGNSFATPHLKIGNQLVEVTGMKRRKKVAELIADNPELQNKWLNTDTYPVNELTPLARDYNAQSKQ